MGRKVFGASRLRRKLKRMPDEVTDELRETIRKEMTAVYDDVIPEVPVSNNPGPRGHLRDAIQVKFSKDGLLGRVGLIGRKRNDDFFYAKFFEFGTKRPELPKKPFLYPAWVRRRDHLRRQVRKATIRALRRVAGRKVSDA